MLQPTQDLNVRGTVPLITPAQLEAELSMTPAANRTVVAARDAVKAAIQGKDTRPIAIVGPCSIHDIGHATEYANRLNDLARRVADRLHVVMRVYFEKPRTTVGWKGLINDPHLNDTFDIPTGLRRARKLLLHIAQLGLPAATELLEPITPQYIDDLLAVASIGARTTESPTHRQMASGLSMPVGFKNGTDGSMQVALDAMQAAGSAHAFLGMDSDGRTCIVQTKGNPFGFLILRGGRSGPNYSAADLENASQKLSAAKLCPRFVIDCSHGNSEKDHRKQAGVWRSVIEQRVKGNTAILGLMLESNLREGAQKLTADPAALKPGVSITDACIGWEETEALILEAHKSLS